MRLFPELDETFGVGQHCCVDKGHVLLEGPLGVCHFSVIQSYLQLSSSSFDGSSRRRLESNENYGLTSNLANVEPVSISYEAPSGQILSSDHIG